MGRAVTKPKDRPKGPPGSASNPIGVVPKGAVADAWVNRAGIGQPPEWHVDGLHWVKPPKRAKAEPEPGAKRKVQRGAVQGQLL